LRGLGGGSGCAGDLVNVAADRSRDVDGLIDVLAAFGYAEHLFVGATL